MLCARRPSRKSPAAQRSVRLGQFMALGAISVPFGWIFAGSGMVTAAVASSFPYDDSPSFDREITLGRRYHGDGTILSPLLPRYLPGIDYVYMWRSVDAQPVFFKPHILYCPLAICKSSRYYLLYNQYTLPAAVQLTCRDLCSFQGKIPSIYSCQASLSDPYP